MIEPSKEHCVFTPNVLFNRNQLSPNTGRCWLKKLLSLPLKKISGLMNGIRFPCLPKQIKLCFFHEISIRTGHTLRHKQMPKTLWNKIIIKGTHNVDIQSLKITAITLMTKKMTM